MQLLESTWSQPSRNCKSWVTLDLIQSSFCPGHETEIALVTFMDDLKRHLDQGGSALLLVLDLTAVFNMVDYDLLTHSLVDAGIRGLRFSGFSPFFMIRDRGWYLGEGLSWWHLIAVWSRRQAIPWRCWASISTPSPSWSGDMGSVAINMWITFSSICWWMECTPDILDRAYRLCLKGYKSVSWI